MHEDSIGAAMYGGYEDIAEGSTVRGTGKVWRCPSVWRCWAAWWTRWAARWTAGRPLRPKSTA